MNARTDLNEFITHYEKKILEYKELENYHTHNKEYSCSKVSNGLAETYKAIREESEILLGFLIELKDRREQDEI